MHFFSERPAFFDALEAMHGHRPALSIDPLGPGWHETERALSDIRADFTRTIQDAPPLLLLWHELDGGQRWGYVGKALDWYFGADGGFQLSPNYIESVIDLANQVRGAVNDNILGYLTDWPLCPDDGWPLHVLTRPSGGCYWHCRHGDHDIAELGRLNASL
ncbi:MAG: hypothetical protein ACTHMS_22435 [Jatrophihabitans sp.]|uniref:hypothetical protein n=1 Tax=Jatrophihabitans sp. TaxID=1932789 RepID=UPI003F7CE4EB